MKIAVVFFIFLINTLFIACQSASHTQAEDVVTISNEKKPPRSGSYKVVKVIDGDTFWVEGDTERFKVRFIGIDAPETRNFKGKPKSAFAEKAKDFVEKLTLRKTVTLELDVQHFDRYRRVLAYIYLDDGIFLNAELIKQGYAVVSTYPPNVKHVELFESLQKNAQTALRGLWSDRSLE